jgi:SAM-dependent methyltransferase
VSPLAPETLDVLRASLEPLEWADRFEHIAHSFKAADPEGRDAIARLRSELAARALAELSAGWNGAPFKDAILRVPAKRLRGALTRAAKEARNRYVLETMRAGGPPLGMLGPGARFAEGLDERSVELPLALAVAALHQSGRVLDAGAALNLPLVREAVPAPAARLTHFTLPGSKEPDLADQAGHFEYAFGDLRTMPYADATFDRVVCVSTLEHVAMDNTRFGTAEGPGGGSAADALAELLRVLVPGGELLLTVPYGVAAEHGWFRILGARELDGLLAPARQGRVDVRFFYYDRGWFEGGPDVPESVAAAGFVPDVITGVAVARVVTPGGAR